MSSFAPSNFTTNVAIRFVEAIAAAPQSMLSEAVNWIVENYGPEEIYDLKVLEEWAKNNGYVRDVEDQ